MTPISDLIKLFDKFIVEHGSASVMGLNLSLVKDQLKIAVEEVAKLEKENSDLKQKVLELTSELEEYRIPKDMFEHRGCLFKRGQDGKVLPTVYCPRCKRAMSSMHPTVSFACNEHQFSSPFTGAELNVILEEIK